MGKPLFVEKGHILRIIEEWRKHEVLYNANHPNYNNKYLRSKANQSIFAALVKQYPNFEGTAVMVKEKIKSLRVQYLRELKRTKYDAEYKPTLFCFSQLGFLCKFSNLRLGVASNRHKRASSSNAAEVLPKDKKAEPIEVDNRHEVNSSISDSTSTSTADESDAQHLCDATDNALRAATTALQSVADSFDQSSVDGSFAQYVKHEMMMMRSAALKTSLRENIISIIVSYKLKSRAKLARI